MTRLIAAARSSGREILRGPRLVKPARGVSGSAVVEAPWFASTMDVRSISVLLLCPRRFRDVRVWALSSRAWRHGSTVAIVPYDRTVIHNSHEHASARPTSTGSSREYVI